jgi:hypothetical protein
MRARSLPFPVGKQPVLPAFPFLLDHLDGTLLEGWRAPHSVPLPRRRRAARAWQRFSSSMPITL